MKHVTFAFVVLSFLAACGRDDITPLTVPFTATSPAASATPSNATNVSPAPRPVLTPATQEILVIPAGWVDESAPNFNPFSYDYISVLTRPLTYEPLMLYHRPKAEVIPWLATGYRWGDGNQTLTFLLREGVKWSDGTPFTAQDVVFHFSLLKKIADEEGEQAYPSLPVRFIKEIAAPDDFTVVFTFSEVNTLFFYDLIQVPITPKHIWENVDDLSGVKNLNPVGTGPFTQVTWFENLGVSMEKVVQIERNPYYWQHGKPAIQGIRFSSRPEENLRADLIQGKLDWAFEDLPNFEQDYVSQDPQNYHAGVYPGSTVLLLLNTSRTPLDNAEMRMAISMAINRERINETIFHKHTFPATANGLGDILKSWWDDEAIRAGTWIGYHPEQAAAILDRLGYRRTGSGLREGPEGLLRFLFVGESSYPQENAAVAQAIAQDLKDLGIEVSLSISDDGTAWEKIRNGEYDLAISLGMRGNTPYDFYSAYMSASGSTDYGGKTNEELKRYTNAEADRLLEEARRESDPARQKTIMDQVQMLFVRDAPAIPLYQAFYTYQYNTQRFTGFPEDDPYLLGSFYTSTSLLVLLNIKPR